MELASLDAGLRERTGAFIDYLDRWLEDLTPLPLEDLITEAGGPNHVAIFCVDLVNGFCHGGPLASERVRSIIPNVVDLFERAHAAGIRNFILPQDSHDPEAAEFADFPPHCIRGTDESRTVPELDELPFASLYRVLQKNTVHSAIGTRLNDWMVSHPEVTRRIVVGDCTDICVFHLAMHLKVRSNQDNRHLPVIVPADCVDTYDLSMESARQIEGLPHPADVFHPVFLYNMAINGVKIVRSLT